MPLSTDIQHQLRRFLQSSLFAGEGAVITDLDGTAVHEFKGRIAIPEPVEFGLKALRDLGRPVIINSLRFPLNVIRTFGQEWDRIAHTPIPTISLNGSILGHITRKGGEIVFDEVAAFPLTTVEIDEVLRGVKGLLDDDVDDLLLFFYPRDWRQGEIIWTPAADRVESIRAKYVSAASVIAVPFDQLRETLMAQDICMIFLLIDVPQDQLMAYQHTKRSNFFTRKGVDKQFGATEFAARLGADLDHSVGAGDTELDTFLCCVGMAVLVGPLPLEFQGVKETVKIDNSLELGEVLFALADGLKHVGIRGEEVQGS